MSCCVVDRSVSTMPYCDIILLHCDSTVFIMLPQCSLVILQWPCNKCDIRVSLLCHHRPNSKTTLTLYCMTGTCIFSVKCPIVITFYWHTVWSHSYCFFAICYGGVPKSTTVTSQYSLLYQQHLMDTSQY